MNYCYLDYASATPVDPMVASVMRNYAENQFANPSSPHSPGQRARTSLEAARAEVAGILGVKSSEIIFTSGSTEGAQIAIAGVLETFPGSGVVVSSIEHKAILQTAANFCHTLPASIACDARGIVQPEAVVASISDTTALVCVQYANNEIGTLQPIAKIALEMAKIRIQRAKRNVKLPLYLYCDAAQAGLLSLQMSRLGVDLLSMGGSKIYGPAGSGFLYIRTGVALKPLFEGGGQERGLRGGSENVAAAVGLGAALGLVQRSRSIESKRLKGLREDLRKTILQTIEGVQLNGSLDHRLPGNLHLSFDNCLGEDLVAHLDVAGFAVATGSACTAAYQDPSHVLLAIGCSRERAESSLRISLGRLTTVAELDRFAVSLALAVKNIRQHAINRDGLQ